MSVLLRAIVLVLVAAVGAHAQVLNSGSNGSDGALSLTTPGEVIFNPVALGLDADRDNVFHFTTITIGPGVTVRMPFNALQGLPVIWLAQGAVQIHGTVDLSGQNGAAAIPGALNRASVPGPGGYAGGVGPGVQVLSARIFSWAWGPEELGRATMRGMLCQERILVLVGRLEPLTGTHSWSRCVVAREAGAEFSLPLPAVEAGREGEHFESSAPRRSS